MNQVMEEVLIDSFFKEKLYQIIDAREEIEAIVKINFITQIPQVGIIWDYIRFQGGTILG